MASSAATSTTTITVVVGTIVISAPFFYRALLYLADYVFGVHRRKEEELEGLHVLIKTADKTVPIFLSPKWSIGEVKDRLANAVGKDAEDLRIIVAGHELRDDVIVGDCDLGQSTVIHAVKVIHRPTLPSNDNVHKQQEEFVENIEEAESLEDQNEQENDLSSNGRLSYQGDKPMNECLLDLQLTKEERLRFEKINIDGSTLSDSVIANEVYKEDTTENSEKRPIADEKARIKAHFWVYCSQLQCGRTLQPGKLRVRCSSCKGGAIIVKSDPCNWDDVLNSGRIDGYCQNDNCNVPSELEDNQTNSIKVRGAEFYFKCSGSDHHINHTKEDNYTYTSAVKSSEHNPVTSEAPPLYLIRSNLKEISCLACSDNDVNPVLVFGCPDHHVICLSCFRDYCISRLNDRSFTLHDELGYTLGCPVGCENSFIDSSSKHFSAILSNSLSDDKNSNQYERYQRFAAEQFVIQAGGILCPQPNCGTGIMPNNDTLSNTDTDSTEERKVVCTECKYVFCRICLQGYHIGECNETLEWQDEIQSDIHNSVTTTIGTDRSLASRARWLPDDRNDREQLLSVGQSSSWAAIRITTKPCPKCRTPTERSGGCMHMDCVKPGCGFQWCWICQTEWTRDCMGNHWFG